MLPLCRRVKHHVRQTDASSSVEKLLHQVSETIHWDLRQSPWTLADYLTFYSTARSPDDFGLLSYIPRHQTGIFLSLQSYICHHKVLFGQFRPDSFSVTWKLSTRIFKAKTQTANPHWAPLCAFAGWEAGLATTALKTHLVHSFDSSYGISQLLIVAFSYDLLILQTKNKYSEHHTVFPNRTLTPSKGLSIKPSFRSS